MSVADEDAERGIRDSFHCTYGLQRSRKIAERTGLLECVFAELQYSGGCFDPRGRIRIRINRFSTRVTLKAEVFDSWDDEPCEIKRRILTNEDWHGVISWMDSVDFWNLQSTRRPAGAGFGGAFWTIEGFTGDRFHFVRRSTWNRIDGVGEEIYRLGSNIVELAGVRLPS
jgi:hypothetical protein